MMSLLQATFVLLICSHIKPYEVEDTYLWGQPELPEEIYVEFEKSLSLNSFAAGNFSSPIYAGEAKRDVMLWLAYSAPNDTYWDAMLASVNTNRNSLTRVCINGYQVTEDGKFGDSSPQYSPQFPRKYATRVKAMGLPVTVMVTGAKNRTYIEKMLSSENLTAAYIDKAISEALTYNYDGYNMDVEQPCSSSECTKRYFEFLKEFAQRLHMINKTLSIDMGNFCYWTDYMGLNCTQMKETGVDRITSMDTYTNIFEDFKRYVTLAQATLRSVYAAGMERNKLLASREAMDFLISQNVTGIGIFRNPPTNQAMWDAMAYFKYH